MEKIKLEQLGNCMPTKNRDNPDQGRVFNANGLCPAITTMQGGGRQPMTVEIRQATRSGLIPMDVGGVADLNYPGSHTRRGRVIDRGQISPTIQTASIPSVIEEWTWEIDNEIYLIRIRKLTPKECFRLMGFDDNDFEKAEKVNSNTQLYKEAGNSIVVNVLEEIFKEML